MNNAEATQYDIVIVGAGMVGASLALGLSRFMGDGLKIAVIEAIPPGAAQEPSYDDRSLVLSLSAQRILKGFGLWAELSDKVLPIEKVHVSEQQGFAAVRMDKSMLGLPALAYVIVARELGHGLLNKMAEIPNLDMYCPATVTDVEQNENRVSVTINQGGSTQQLSSRLLVLADGSLSKTREMLSFSLNEKDYGQSAIVTNVTTEKPHGFTAYERFNSEGPFALLPVAMDRLGMVFTSRNEDLSDYMNMDDDTFLAAAEKRFGRRLGRFLRIGKRKSYPLRLIRSKEAYQGRALLLGNSAHTIHPNMAQGFNLGLRDVAALVEVLSQADREETDIGSRECLQRYVEMRQADQEQVIRYTDGLGQIFYNDDIIKSALRRIGMLMTDLIPPVKRSLMQRAMGLKGQQPVLVRQS